VTNGSNVQLSVQHLCRVRLQVALLSYCVKLLLATTKCFVVQVVCIGEY
jgi:hypothetical protein